MSTEHPETPTDLAPAWQGLLDDATALAADADVGAAVAAHDAARTHAYGQLLGRLLLPDTDLPGAKGTEHPLHVVLTGGAGQVAGPAALANRSGLTLAGLEVQLRDVDDLVGNVRRVVAAVHAAQDDGDLDEDVPVHVEIPVDQPALGRGTPAGGWLRAVDEVAAAELRLTLRVGSADADLVPSAATVAAWIDASLDRETPFRVAGGSHQAVTEPGVHGPETYGAYGFANLLLATRRAFDGLGTTVVVETLVETAPATLGEWLRSEEYLAATRRWCTGVAPVPNGETAASLRTAHEGLMATLGA